MKAFRSVRLRTTLGAVLVVAVALGLASIALVLVVRDSLEDAARGAAEQRAEELADQFEAGGAVSAPTGDDDRDDEDDDEDDEPEDLVWQVIDEGGDVVQASQPLATSLPRDDGARVDLPGGEASYVVAVADADAADGEVDVVVAASLGDVEETTTALVAPLAIGAPLLLLVVAGTTWLVVGRALRPVDRIRREVDQISGASLERRVPEPGSGDEIHRLAATMNRMLGRLQGSHQRQQEFVSDASHELRSPLASIRQAAEVTKAHPAALPGDELADVVLDEATRMQDLVTQLLLLARAGEGGLGRTEDVDLDDLALTAARRAQRRGADVVTTGVGAARVRGDLTALSQLVTNLVDNATRHARSRVVLEVVDTGTGARLVVEDDGAGVPADQRARIFERFVRLDDARARDDGGSGLGLAIVRAVAQAHGGTARVEDRAGGGARFVVDLPAGT